MNIEGDSFPVFPVKGGSGPSCPPSDFCVQMKPTLTKYVNFNGLAMKITQMCTLLFVHSLSKILGHH